MKVYTSIAGDYPIRRADVTCIGDDGVFKRPVMEAKRAKILPHLFFPAEPITVWVDGNISFKPNAAQVVADFLGDADLAVFRHPVRKNVWQEFAALKAQERFQIPYLQAQLAAQERDYRQAKLPADAPLFECNFMIRRNNERVNRLMEAWWAQVCRWQWRDQVSLPFVLWKYGADVRLRAIDGCDIRKHPQFVYVKHH